MVGPVDGFHQRRIQIHCTYLQSSEITSVQIQSVLDVSTYKHSMGLSSIPSL